MTYEIKKGVPMPLNGNAKYYGAELRSALKLLEVSDMFDTGLTRKQFPAQSVAAFLRHNPTMRIVTRTIQATNTIGVWRVEDRKL